jgi:hypothetical protein
MNDGKQFEITLEVTSNGMKRESSMLDRIHTLGSVVERAILLMEDSVRLGLVILATTHLGDILDDNDLKLVSILVEQHLQVGPFCLRTNRPTDRVPLLKESADNPDGERKMFYSPNRTTQ